MPQRQAFFLVNAMNPLVIVSPSFPAQHHEHPLAPVVDARLRDLTHSQTNGTAVTRLGSVGEG